MDKSATNWTISYEDANGEVHTLTVYAFQLDEIGRGHHQNVVVADKAFEPLHRDGNERLSAEKRHKLLGTRRTAHRPEALASPPRHNHHIKIFFFSHFH